MGKISSTKGNLLEDAVEMIEKMIFRTNPAFQKSIIRIERKRILVVDEVQHEIDLYVEIDSGHGYRSVFIFECKNWDAETVGKNEVIVLSEKIKAANAQKGYLIAKKFGKYAIAQAKKDARIELVEATDDFSDLQPFPDTHFVSASPTHTVIEMHERILPTETVEKAPLDLKNAKLKFKGESVETNDFVKPFREHVMDDRLGNEPTQKLDNGVYKYSHEKEFQFEKGELICEIKGKEIDMQTIKMKVDFEITVIRPRIISKFDVAKRGRVIVFETVIMPSGSKLDFKLAAINNS